MKVASMTDLEPIKRYRLPNGLLLEIFDISRHYYGGYWRVGMEFRCDVPVDISLSGTMSAADLRSFFGADSLLFLRKTEKMAVHQERLEQAKLEILDGLEKNVLPFVAKDNFPTSFIASEYRQRSKRAANGIPCLY